MSSLPIRTADRKVEVAWFSALCNARRVLPKLPTCKLNEGQRRKVPDPVTPRTTRGRK